MLNLFASLALFAPILDAPPPDQLTIDPLGWAAHQSALCDCPAPLMDFLTYQLPPRQDDDLASARGDGGKEHLAIMQLINERWGVYYDLEAYSGKQPDFQYVDDWHAWVEDVQEVHLIRSGYRHVPGSRQVSTTKNPVVSRVPPEVTTLTLECPECASANCDATRLALKAMQAVHDGSFSAACVDGCADPENEMRSRVLDMIWDLGPTSGGFFFKIKAMKAPIELRTVHAKLTPVWGEQFEISLPVFGIEIPFISWMHGYRVHILSPENGWQSRTADLHQPRPHTVPPWVPYPSCHPQSPGTPAPSSPAPTPPGNNHGGGCYVSLPRPVP